MTTMETIDKILEEKQLRLVDNVWIDVQTANAIKLVYNALNETNKEKFLRLGIVQMGQFSWKACK